jgi:exonuclease 3'-5' domain-containing protein 1
MGGLGKIVLGQIILRAFLVQPTDTSKAFLHQQLGSASGKRQLHRINPVKLASDMASLDVLAIIEDKLSTLSHCEAISETDRAQMLVTMVDTPAAIGSLVDILAPLEQSLSSIYLDLEGINLSRYGSVSLLQIFVPSCQQPFIVDIHTLGVQAFNASNSEGKTLKNVLESKIIKKHLFDARNDSDALYSLFGVRLAGIVDIQLLELASRRGAKHIVCGLAACVEQEQALPSLALSQWQSTKKEVVKMFDPKLGGSYEIFNKRPLPQILIEYCIGDVQVLPILTTIYQSRLNNHWSKEVLAETEKRLEDSRSPGYQPRGKQKIFGPRNWRYPRKGGTKPAGRMATSTNRQASLSSMRSKAVTQPMVNYESHNFTHNLLD